LDDGLIVGTAQTDEHQTGFPGIVQGGLLSAYFDEVCWHQAASEGDKNAFSMTLEMNIHYWAKVTTGSKLMVIALPPEIEGRHYHVSGAILLPDLTIATTATMHYLMLKQSDTTYKREGARLKHTWEAERDSFYF